MAKCNVMLMGLVLATVLHTALGMQTQKDPTWWDNADVQYLKCITSEAGKRIQPIPLVNLCEKEKYQEWITKHITDIQQVLNKPICLKLEGWDGLTGVITSVYAKRDALTGNKYEKTLSGREKFYKMKLIPHQGQNDHQMRPWQGSKYDLTKCLMKQRDGHYIIVESHITKYVHESVIKKQTFGKKVTVKGLTNPQKQKCNGKKGTILDVTYTCKECRGKTPILRKQCKACGGCNWRIYGGLKYQLKMDMCPELTIEVSQENILFHGEEIMPKPVRRSARQPKPMIDPKLNFNPERQSYPELPTSASRKTRMCSSQSCDKTAAFFYSRGNSGYRKPICMGCKKIAERTQKRYLKSKEYKRGRIVRFQEILTRRRLVSAPLARAMKPGGWGERSEQNNRNLNNNRRRLSFRGSRLIARERRLSFRGRRLIARERRLRRLRQFRY